MPSHIHYGAHAHNTPRSKVKHHKSLGTSQPTPDPGRTGNSLQSQGNIRRCPTVVIVGKYCKGSCDNGTNEHGADVGGQEHSASVLHCVGSRLIAGDYKLSDIVVRDLGGQCAQKSRRSSTDGSLMKGLVRDREVKRY